MYLKHAIYCMCVYKINNANNTPYIYIRNEARFLNSWKKATENTFKTNVEPTVSVFGP